MRKVVSGFGKKSYVSTGVRKPGNMYASHDMTLAVKVALNPNTTNQLKMGHVRSKTRSLGQILEEPCVCSRGHIFSLIDYHETWSECLS